MRRRWARPVLALLLVAAGIVTARALGLGDLARLENLARLKQWLEGYGALAPAVYIAGYILAVVFFVPGLPITVLGGVAFGPLWGTLYVWIAATIGAGLAFLAARYGVRGTVERWVAGSPRLRKIDGQVAKHGWRIVMLTRLVPFFPFNLQNYAYGLTRIGFWPYVITSSICMLPATAAFTFAGGALSDGRGDVKQTLAYLATAGVLLVLISLIPRWLQHRSRLAGDLLKAGVIAVLLGIALPARAADENAYARLLRAHVRAGVAAGITVSCGSRWCPDLRAEPFDTTRLWAQRDEQAAAFLSNTTMGLRPGTAGKTARVSSIFRWFAGDSSASGGVATFIRAKSSPEVAARRRRVF